MGTIILNSVVFIYVGLKIMSPVITTIFLNPNYARSVTASILLLIFFSCLGISGAPILSMSWNAIPVYAAFALTVIVFLLASFVFEPKFKRYYERAHPGKPNECSRNGATA
jgi:hypothetical protein